MTGLLIGAVAKQSGVSVPTIRYYETMGLLSAAPRSITGYRRYGREVLDELRFIKKAQGLGFSLDEIKEVLTLTRSGTHPCMHVLDLARRHLRALDERIAQLTRFRGRLANEISKWDGIEQPTCQGLCRIITEADDDAGIPPAPLDPRRPQRARS
jgi:MerR family copper efflux transcriptional regulator